MTRWERVYSGSMADFTREEVIQVVEGGRKCVGADLREAKYNANTKWPEGVDPVAAGALLVDWPAGVRNYGEPDR